MMESHSRPTSKSKDQNPLFYVGASLGLIFLLWFYFYVEVPYSTISDAQLFWGAFIVWALMPIVFALRYGNSGSKTGFNFMIMIGIIGLFLGLGLRWIPFLTPLALAFIPGLFVGTIVGADGWFVSSRRKKKGVSDE